MARKNGIDYFKLIVSLAVCLSAGFLGSFFTASSIESWYGTLNQPSFNPPNWVFGPVWTVLYILMGVSLYLVWKKTENKKVKFFAISLFAVQLALNTLWSILFFGLRSPLLAFIGIVLLWLAIVSTMIAFNRIDKTAMYLLIPYLAWVSFAAILNLSYVILN